MFDASNRQTCRVRPSNTSTPLHSLTTLNDPTWGEAARALAQRSMKASTVLDERLSFAFREVVARRPTANDMKALKRAYDRQAQFYTADVKAAKALLSIGASWRDESLNPTEHAALASVCLAILNLDEALTRE
jgi:hypothetical protein